jgi:hypothetical protein
MITTPKKPNSLVGMGLKAWVFVGYGGTKLKGAGCTVLRTSTGSYTVTFDKPMTGINYMMDSVIFPEASPSSMNTDGVIVSGRTTAACTVNTMQSNTATNTPVLMAFYE